jgi:hypothetical protein
MRVALCKASRASRSLASLYVEAGNGEAVTSASAYILHKPSMGPCRATRL